MTTDVAFCPSCGEPRLMPWAGRDGGPRWECDFCLSLFSLRRLRGPTPGWNGGLT